MKLFNKSFVLLLMATFFYMLSLSMGNPIIAGFTGELGGSGVIMGVAGGILNVCSLCCRPLAGSAVDRYDRRRLAMLGLGMMILSNAGYCFSPAPICLILFRLLNGVGFAVSSITLSTSVGASLPPERIGSGMGIYGMVQALSMAFAPTVALWLSDEWGYRAAFAVSGLFALVAFLIILLKGGNDEQKDSPIRERSENRFFAKEVLPTALVVMLVTLPYSALSAFIATFAGDRGLDLNVGLYFPLYAVFLIVFRIVFSRFFDRWSYCRFVLLCTPAAAASLAVVNFMNGFLMMAAAALLMALGYGVLVSVSQANGIRKVSIAHQGIANSTYYIGLDMGLAGGPILAGFLYTHLGSDYMFLAMAAVPLLAYGVLAAKGKTI
ncbi:MFS transporter [Anaerovorax odorimutans]|uniref:MFS transporter n=1 Tax=Anaerovorax odorimutans TaxID=109327 RepID=A0ABT1RT18_9FIRM|nr:MFS transporter [Anaerovorax odorimutans]MCQ4638340.1 MFS transporter [Anaerovorax odorimutans]